MCIYIFLYWPKEFNNMYFFRGVPGRVAKLLFLIDFIPFIFLPFIYTLCAINDRVHLTSLTCSLYTKREQVLNSSENPQNWAARISAISCYLGHESMIFQHQLFYLMLFYNSCFHNSFQKVWQQINSYTKHIDLVFILIIV